MRTPLHERIARLEARARRRLEVLAEELPVPLREVFDETAIILSPQPWPSLDPDTLGLCEGFEAGQHSEAPGPIHLFLLPISTYAALNSLSFEGEVERTLLHELGHRLGFDEDELDARGLG